MELVDSDSCFVLESVVLVFECDVEFFFNFLVFEFGKIKLFFGISNVFDFLYFKMNICCNNV